MASPAWPEAPERVPKAPFPWRARQDGKAGQESLRRATPREATRGEPARGADSRPMRARVPRDPVPGIAGSRSPGIPWPGSRVRWAGVPPGWGPYPVRTPGAPLGPQGYALWYDPARAPLGPVLLVAAS